MPSHTGPHGEAPGSVRGRRSEGDTGAEAFIVAHVGWSQWGRVRRLAGLGLPGLGHFPGFRVEGLSVAVWYLTLGSRRQRNAASRGARTRQRRCLECGRRVGSFA